MLEFLEWLIGTANHIVWWPLPAMLLATGLFTTIATRFIQGRRLKHAVEVVAGKYDDPDHEGDITHFQALATALSATVGIGNIAGVALAIHYGGPGAIFWMWLTAIFGMSLKYVECTLALGFRDFDAHGNAAGGPMYTIEKGMGPKWKWMAMLFAFAGFCASFGGGNMAQSNSLTESLVAAAGLGGLPQWRFIIGIVCAALVGAVILGGIQRIGAVSSKLAPAMAILYFVAALVILVLNFGELPSAVGEIVSQAFNPTASVSGSFAGTILTAVSWGVKRGLFSNEAGQGSAPIAHSAARTDEPVREGVVAMLGPLIDTLIICTMTAMVIMVTNTWDQKYTTDVSLGETAPVMRLTKAPGEQNNTSAYNARLLEAAPKALAGLRLRADDGHIGADRDPVLFFHNDAPLESVRIYHPDKETPYTGWLLFDDQGVLRTESDVYDLDPSTLVLRGRGLLNGSVLTAKAFEKGLYPVFKHGDLIVTLCVLLFALSTIVSWSYYGDRCAVYLLGTGGILPYRLAYTFFVFLGAVASLEVVWTYGDLSMGMMTIPNLISVVVLIKIVQKGTKEYFTKMDQESASS